MQKLYCPRSWRMLFLLLVTALSGVVAAPADDLWGEVEASAALSTEIATASVESGGASAVAAPDENENSDLLPVEERASSQEPLETTDSEESPSEAEALDVAAPPSTDTTVETAELAAPEVEAAESAPPVLEEKEAAPEEPHQPPALDSVALAKQSAAASKRQELLGPVKVSQIAGVSELDSYRSPKKALFFSLLLPGLGQLYTGGTTATKVRGGLYLALEAGLIAGWWKLGLQEYNDRIDESRRWSSAHFSRSGYEQRLRTLYKEAQNADASEQFQATNLSHRIQWCQSLYSSSDEKAIAICNRPGIDDFDNHIANISSKEFSPYDRNSYEVLLETGDLLLGWDDTKALNIDYSSNFSEIVSNNQEQYRALRDKANRAAEVQTLFIGGIILNHIISAVDAALTAHFHNQKLYERASSPSPQLRLYGGSEWRGDQLHTKLTAAVLF